MNTRQAQEYLKRIGWPLTIDGSYGHATRSAIKEFQAGYGKAQLLVDGYCGPTTQKYLKRCVTENGKTGEFFTFQEFASKGNGWIKVDRELVRALDITRRHFGPIAILSGYRDVSHNRRVGGQPNSQHLYGNAVDLRFLRRPVKHTELDDLKVFSGIGYRRSDGVVLHADVRHMGPNTTKSSIHRPARWIYG